MIGRAALAAGVSWWLADLTSTGATPILTTFTALVVIQVSTRASVRMAIARTAAVVVGALLGLAVGATLPLRGLTVAILVAVALLLADFALRLPLAAARQVPMGMLVVIAAVSADEPVAIGLRVAQTAMGAAVGAAVTLLLPVSRVADCRRLLVERARRVSGVYADVASGLAAEWTVELAATWRRRAAPVADEVEEAASDVHLARNAAAWSYRRRRDRAALDELATWTQWLDAAAAAMTTLAGDLEHLASRVTTPRPPMPAVSVMLTSVATAIAETARHAAAPVDDDTADRALRRVATEGRHGPGSDLPPEVVDDASVAGDVRRLAVRLRPSGGAVTSPAAWPSPR
jgi:hypothetical protein